MRLRCARASLRSSGEVSERERLRGGSVDDEGAGEWEASAGGEGRASSVSAARFMAEALYVDVTWRSGGQRKGRGFVELS